MKASDETPIKELFAEDMLVANFMRKTGCVAACGVSFYDKGPHVGIIHEGKKIIPPHNSVLENNISFLIGKVKHGS